jgi:NAD(P)-dependent dehydrogenase (short-subunit alcohol dehydrogenase family)
MDAGVVKQLPGLFAQGRILLAQADVTKEGEVSGFLTKVIAEFRGVDYLINVAGGYAGGNLIEETPVQEWDRMMELNLKSAFLMTKSVLPSMKKQRFGRIVNIAAMPAVLPSAKRVGYAVAKRGVAALTEATHEEVKGSGVTVNAIAPSIILTEANLNSMPEADKSKWVTPNEIAKLLLYLCSDDARSVSGNVIRIFGGF